MALPGPAQPKPRRSPRQARAAATVDAIIEATIQVLVAHGPERLTTTRVSERAGVSVGTLYQYFPDKHALLFATVERYLDDVARQVEQACATHRGQPLPVACEALVTAYIGAKCRAPEASAALYKASAAIDVTALVNATFSRFDKAAVALFKSAPDARLDDAARDAFAVLAAVTGATRTAFERGADPQLLASLRTAMVTMCTRYLQGAAQAPSLGVPAPAGNAMAMPAAGALSAPAA